MWRNYLTVGIRSLTKNKAYALINILGLAIGMAACLLILLFVRYELSYDAFLPDAENTYQFQTHFTEDQTGEKTDLQMAAYVAQAALRKDFPQIERMTYALIGSPVVLQNGEATEADRMLYVDSPFFDVLQFPFAKGDPATALARPGTMVLTETEATRRFGAADPIGKTLVLVAQGRQMPFRITGIVRDPPKNTHVRLTIVARVDMQSFWADQPEFLTSWGWQSGWIYLTLKPGTDPRALEAALPAWEKRNIADETAGTIRYNQGDETEWTFTNIRDVHLGIARSGEMTPGNDRRSILTFGVIALLILGMACVNFTNLATARASQRAREVALRKVLGANRRQLIVQFLGESILVAAIAMLVALALVELLLPVFANFLDAGLEMHYFGRGGVLLPVIGLVLLVGVAGGLYPAFFLSRFQPAAVLKANKSSAEAHGSGRLRSILVVGQFAISIGLIICTAVVYSQTLFARHSDPGFKRENILQVHNIGRRQVTARVDSVVAAVRAIPGVLSVGRSEIAVATLNNHDTGVQVPGRSEPVNIGVYRIDPDFFDAMGIDRVAGRLFDRNRPLDDAHLPFPTDAAAEKALVDRGVNIVINELAARRMGFADPQAAIGKQVRTAFVDLSNGLVPATIVGVVKDSRFRSIRQPLDPIYFLNDKDATDELVIRYSGDPAAVRAQVEAVWKRIVPDVPFDGEYSEDIVRELYKAETSRATIFAAFALLAVIVGCLGLFGLASFTAERRTKEIGIRKVLGARTQDIVRLLVWQFSRPVLIANLIAWPLAWWVMRDWLDTFDARITLGPGPFLAAGALALAIAVLTIGAHAVKVARANPIHALRYE